MAIKTLDMDLLAQQTDNLYETIAILSKRARQVSTKTKAEIDDKLAYFEGFDTDDDHRFQEEQARISKEFEERPEPTEMAITEMLSGEIYFRDSRAETEDF